MPVSINSKLLQLSTEYYIRYGSYEQKNIDTSVATLISRLKNYFINDVKSIEEFGSYKRDTILPRKYDSYSDVDLLIKFNHTRLQVTPLTYRNYLIKFAEVWYSRSNVFKSSPTVVLELDQIKYDLVPAYEESFQWITNTTTYIPQSDSSWMITDPHGFNSQLTNANIQSGSNIKKVIRLLKAWNAKVGYPIASYTLEQQVVGIMYWFCNSLEDYFFYAINQLPSYTNGNVYNPIQKVLSLKENAIRVKSCLEANNNEGANGWLAHILPF